MQALELMPVSVAQTTAPRTTLRSVGRIDQKDWNDHHFYFFSDAFKKQSVRELMQSSVKGFAAFFTLRELEVLKSQDGISANPCNEAFGECLTVGLGEFSLAERQPFQHSANTSCVLVLRLTLRQLSLQPCHLLAMLLPPNPQLKTTLKENLARFLNSNEQVGFIAVNADQNRTFHNGLWERHAQITDQLTVAFLDRQAVKGKGIQEVAEKVFRDKESQSLSPADRPEAYRAIPFNSRIPFPLSDEEDSERLFERDCARKFSVFSSGIAASDEADGSAGHLCADNAFNLVVSMFLKGTSRKGFAAVPANW